MVMLSAIHEATAATVLTVAAADELASSCTSSGFGQARGTAGSLLSGEATGELDWETLPSPVSVSRELVSAFSTSSLSAAALSEHMGLGMEIGAFAAGVMVGGGSSGSGGGGGDNKGVAVAAVIDPVRGLFSALQLASVGLLFRCGYCLRHAPALITGLIGIVTLKWVVGTLTVRAAGAAPVPALAVGACTAQVGELGLALLNRAHVLGIVSKKFHRPLLSVAVISLVSTPVLNFRVLPWVLRMVLSLPFGRWLIGCLGAGGGGGGGSNYYNSGKGSKGRGRGGGGCYGGDSDEDENTVHAGARQTENENDDDAMMMMKTEGGGGDGGSFHNLRVAGGGGGDSQPDVHRRVVAPQHGTLSASTTMMPPV